MAKARPRNKSENIVFKKVMGCLKRKPKDDQRHCQKCHSVFHFIYIYIKSLQGHACRLRPFSPCTYDYREDITLRCSHYTFKDEQLWLVFFIPSGVHVLRQLRFSWRNFRRRKPFPSIFPVHLGAIQSYSTLGYLSTTIPLSFSGNICYDQVDHNHEG